MTGRPSSMRAAAQILSPVRAVLGSEAAQPLDRHREIAVSRPARGANGGGGNLTLPAREGIDLDRTHQSSTVDRSFCDGNRGSWVPTWNAAYPWTVASEQ